MFDVGVGELLVVLVIALIIFGPKRLPELASALGKSVNEFKNALHSENKQEEKKEESKK